MLRAMCKNITLSVNRIFPSTLLFGLFFYAMLLTGCGVINKIRYRNCAILFTEDNIYVEAPGIITLEFSLQTCDNKAVPNLTENNFTLFEDDSKLSEFEAPLRVELSPQDYKYEALLLLDMSGSIIDSGNLQALIEAANSFVEEMGEGTRIAVYTFDGRPGNQIEQVVDFTNNVTLLQNGIQGLQSYVVVDKSTNIYGAVEEAIRILDSRPKDSKDVIHATSLIVFTDGTHRAGTGKTGYPEWERVYSKVVETDHSIFTIGLGGEINKEELENIGKSGSVVAKKAGDLPDAFKELVDFANSSYVITYCSPARAGTHALAVQANWKGMEGEINYEFSANDFSGGCTLER
jgi:hypothetical protein